MGFVRFRTVCTVLMAALLLALFWLPQRMLLRASDAWTAQMDAAQDALQKGDTTGAQAVCSELLQSYQSREKQLERFLNHDAVDSVLTALQQAASLAAVQDISGALAALTDARGGLAHLLCIERFTWNALL